MSTLRCTNLQDTSGGNSLTTAQIYNGAAKAWVNFNGTSTVAIRAQFNVSSITDNGTGDYTVNFSSALSDTNYVSVFGGHNTGSGDGGWVTTGNASGAYPTGVNTGSLRIVTFQNNGAFQDPQAVYVAIFR